MLADYLQNVPSWWWQLCFGLVVLLSFVQRSKISSKFSDVLSYFIDGILRRTYPINNHYDGSQLPTCPYQWPNGQGDIAKFLKGDENSALWEKQYGGLYRIWSGMSSEVVLTRSEHLKAVFKDSDRHLKAVNNNSGYLLGEILGKCVGLISQDAWKSVRNVTEVPFTHIAAKNYHQMVDKHITRHFRALHSPNALNPSSGNLASGLIDPAADLKMLPFWIVAEVVYGELSPQQELQLRKLAPLREELFKHVIQGGLSRFPISRFFNTKAHRLLNQFKAEWKTFNDAAYDRSKDWPVPPPIVNMYHARNEGKVDEDQIYQTLDEMLYANLDVTTGGLSWNLVFLAAYPAEQQRLREEVTSRAGPEISNEARNAYFESSTTFLASCVSESSRLKPLAAFSVPQAAPTERLVDGFMIPAKTSFVVDSYALNIRNPYWGEDRALYRPARFLERPGTETRYNFWRFGFGPRQCMGKYVADLIIRRTLAKLVMEYEMEMVELGGEWAKNPEVWITHPDFKLRCVKKSD